MSYLNAIAKVRHDILADNEEPTDLLISVNLKAAVLREVEPWVPYSVNESGVTLMGMQVEWTKPVPLTQPQITIRTKKGDTRIVSMLDGDKQ